MAHGGVTSRQPWATHMAFRKGQGFRRPTYGTSPKQEKRVMFRMDLRSLDLLICIFGVLVIIT